MALWDAELLVLPFMLDVTTEIPGEQLWGQTAWIQIPPCYPIAV